jgi:hypothetical protein
MNKALNTTLIIIAILVLAGGIFFAGSIYARFYSFGPGMMFGYGWNNNNSFGPGVTNSGGYAMGPGMMSGRGNFDPGTGMMNGYVWNNSTQSNATPLTADQARQAAQKYIQALNIQGLEIAEVMIFNNNAYVAVKESATGLGAFELLVDPTSQVAYPEYGPNMMWNLKYGGVNHGGMMGSRGGMMSGWNYQSTTPSNVSPDMPVTKDQAITNAQAYLDQFQPGTTAANDPMQFYGYYTLDFSKDGKVAGMMSVNGFNGQIFLHTWHGTFIEESK